MLKKCLYCLGWYSTDRSKRLYCSITCSNRYNKNKGTYKDIILPRFSEELAEFVGILLGDGNIFRSQVKVVLNTKVDAEYIKFMQSFMELLFPGVNSKLLIREKYGCTVVYFSSKKVADFLNDMGIKAGKPIIPSWIFADIKYKLACVRGLVDTEGSIGFKVYNGKSKFSVYRQLTFTNKNPILLGFVIDTLSEVNFSITRTTNKNLYLSNDNQIDLYRFLVGFHNPKLEFKSQLRDHSSYIVRRDAGAV